MQCPQCQQDNRETAAFCRMCGAALRRACLVCGTSFEAGSKFCDGCGAAFEISVARQSVLGSLGSQNSYVPTHSAMEIVTSKAALEGERKQVTVLFADVKGSTERVADLDPDEARRLLDPILSRMMEAVDHYGGTVNQVMGDGIMALFGAPFAQRIMQSGPVIRRSRCKNRSRTTSRTIMRQTKGRFRSASA